MRSLSLLVFLALSGCMICNPYMSSQPFLKARYEAGDRYGTKRTMDAAVQLYIYAQMAANAYSDTSESFLLPANYRVATSFDKGHGLQGVIYERIGSTNNVEEVVIAYRGTEGLSLSDWFYGNLLGTQYGLSDTVVAEARAKYEGVRLVAVGHSLGGGLALHASVCHSGIDAYAFNPSYQIFRCGTEHRNKRVIVAEKNEILSVMRLPWKDPTDIENYEDFYCSILSKHSMFRLARCITHVAAATSTEAAGSLTGNLVAACERR